jgi:adenylate kinase family enzyme
MRRHVIEPYCKTKGIPLVVIPMSEEIEVFLGENPSIAPQVRLDMKSGRLVEDKIVLEVLARALARVEMTEESIYLLDGMPRTMGQIELCLYGVCNKFGVPVEDYTFLNFVTPEFLCGHRSAKRDEGREDDGEDAVITRWAEFKQKTAPAISYLETNAKQLGYGFIEVNGLYIRTQPELTTNLIFGPTSA